VALGILAAMIAGAVLFVYRGQSERLGDLEDKIESGKSLIRTQTETTKVVPDLVHQVDAMKKRYKDFDRRLPHRQELGGFLREISAHLGEEKFSDQLIEPGSPTQEDLFHTLPIIMRFKGSYLTSVDFFKRIDRMERLTRIQKLSISRMSKKGGGGKVIEDSPDGDCDLDIELQLNIYFTES